RPGTRRRPRPVGRTLSPPTRDRRRPVVRRPVVTRATSCMNVVLPGTRRLMERREVLTAKTPVTPLAGPYGHPFHPLFVTLPIGAWICSLVFDVVAHVVSDDRAFATGARWLIGIGVIGGLVAAVFGLMDLMTIPNRSRAFVVGVCHLCLNVAVI